MIYNLFEWKSNEDDYSMEVVTPGATREDFKIELRGRTVTISFEGNNYTYEFRYSFNVEKEFTKKDLSLKLESGVLTVRVKKPKAEKIEIE
jgi:HSP20 family molecular chaperone IbpA